MNKLCCDTVTLYHPDKATQTVRRTVLHRVVWQQGGRAVPDVGGTRLGVAMLLVVPETERTRFGTGYKLAAGDRVLLGDGPEVAWADWGGFVPAEVDGLGVITYVLPLYLRGGLHHVEAGAWWSAGGAGARRLAR